MKRLHFFKLLLSALIIGLLPNPLNAGDKEYIEIEIDGETVGKWMEFASLSEYNSDGKISYTRYSDYELRYEYDKYGNNTHTIFSKNGEVSHSWYKYDRKGIQIYRKDSSGFEMWYDYDKAGNQIHSEDSDGRETWYEYDKYGNPIRHIVKKKDERADVYVALLEYYKNSKTLKKETVYTYQY